MFTSILIASNHQKRNLHVTIVSTIIRLILAFLLIPFFGYFGAAIAVLLGDLSNFIQKYIFILKRLFYFRFDEIMKNTMIATAIMALLTILCYKLNLFLLVGSAAITYFGSLVLLGEWTLHDTYLSSLINARRK